MEKKTLTPEQTKTLVEIIDQAGDLADDLIDWARDTYEQPVWYAMQFDPYDNNIVSCFYGRYDRAEALGWLRWAERTGFTEAYVAKIDALTMTLARRDERPVCLEKIYIEDLDEIE